MNKRSLATLAVIGITAATSGCQKAEADGQGESCAGGRCSDSTGKRCEAPKKQTATNAAERRAFYNRLSSGGKRKFDEMDARHQYMAMEMAEQSCNGKNQCAGMGGCKSMHNSCAAKNSCKGQGGEPVRDPNKAVMLQYMKQNGQR